MGSEWTEACLSELTSKITKGTTPSKKDGGFTNKGINFIKAEAVDINGYIDISRFVFITNDVYEKYKRSQLKADDILFSMAGVILGKVGLVNKDHLPANINQALALIRPIQKIIYPRYLYYYLIQREVYNFVNNSTAQSAQPNINLQEIGKLKIRFPHFRKQQEIAHILGVLDDKIELNRKMNETLESMTQALFKSWFVDFDPVIDNALAAGNEIPEALQERAAARQALGDKRKPLPEEIQKLFPSSFEFSDELGWIPEGWEETPIKEIGQVICGKTPSTKKSEYYGEDIPFITIPDMHNTVIATNTVKKLSKEGADSQSNKYLPPGSICVSCIATPGLVVLTSEDSQTNQQINSIIPFETGVELFLYEALSILGDTVRSSGSGGSVFSNLSKGRFENLTVTLPPVTTQVAFSKLLKATFSKMHNTETESYILSRLRDTLLPKLLSGELRIPDADKLIEEAV